MNSNCPICESTDTRLLAARGRVELHRCRSCGLVFKPLDGKDQDDVQQIQDGVYKDLRLRTEVRVVYGMARDRLDVIRQHKSGGRLLEIGCATGEFLELAEKAGFEAVGIDASMLYADFAKQKGLNVRHGRTEQCLKQGETFDVIAMFHLIEHIPEPKTFLEQIKAHLKDDGLLFVVCPNLDSTTRKPFGYWHSNFQQPDHLMFFTKDTLTDLLRRAGFSAVSVYSKEYPHAFFTSLRGFLAIVFGQRRQKKKLAEGTKAAPSEESVSAFKAVVKALYRRLPYLLGILFYPLTKPYGLLVERRLNGHELCVLARKD